MKSIFFISLLLFAVQAGFSQVFSARKTVYFETDVYKISPVDEAMIKAMLDSTGIRNISQVIIKGHTDNVYDSLYNIRLSRKRAYAVRDFLISQNVDSHLIRLEYFGKNRPVVSNTTDAGKQRNRRVEVEIRYRKIKPVDSSAFIPSINELYGKTARKPQEFCINPDRDTILNCEKGSILYFKANSFRISNNCKGKCITILVKEDFLKSDMILDNLITMSNGNIIESQAMIYTEARDCRGRKLELLNGKDFVTIVPTDSIVPGALVYEGLRNPHDSNMNWNPAGNSSLGNFSLKNINLCRDLSWVYYKCDKCKFFFCRLGRILMPVAGIFNRQIRYENKNYRACQKQLRKNMKVNRSVNTAKITRNRLTEKLSPPCHEIDSLFKKYGVNNYDDLILAINKPLLDKYGVKTIEELEEAIRNEQIGKIELNYLNKQISYDDMKYYIYNRSKTGWANVDCIPDFARMPKVQMIVNVKPGKNIDCKLVWVNRRIIIQGTAENNHYLFNQLPVGQVVWLVILKYQDNKPYLYMKEITSSDSSYDAEFTLYTLDELKEKLKILDRY